MTGTVKDLKELLDDVPDDAAVFFKHEGDAEDKHYIIQDADEAELRYGNQFFIPVNEIDVED